MLAFDAGAWFAAPSHAAGAELVRRVLAIGDAVGHVPDVDLRAAGAPDWWTLADPEGNAVDVGVAVGREERAAVRQQP